jgi:hypothetical protein
MEGVQVGGMMDVDDPAAGKPANVSKKAIAVMNALSSSTAIFPPNDM